MDTKKIINQDFCRSYNDLRLTDLPVAGGKNASLGEMIHELSPKGVRLPGGFIVTADGYRFFIKENNLVEKLENQLARLDSTAFSNLSEIARECRELIRSGITPFALEEQITKNYNSIKGNPAPVAVRSSATAEDLPSASFAGQHDSFLNVHGTQQVLEAVKNCYVSLFNDRAIKYRIDNRFDHMAVAISVGIQQMVRSDKGSAGVAFTLDPETGFRNVIYITGAWGLGENVVQGAVNPDEFYLFKPSISENKFSILKKRKGSKENMMIYTDDPLKPVRNIKTPSSIRNNFCLSDIQAEQLGRWCLQIEKHYNSPMDIEWALDGETMELFILQARPETVHSNRRSQVAIKEYKLRSKESPVCRGKAVGRSIVSGKVCIVKSLDDAEKVQKGDIIVADITNPDWNALLRKAVSIVTNKGGRTSHASIVARELGIHAVVGTMDATKKLHDGQYITVSCIEGDEGKVYDGILEWDEKEIHFTGTVPTQTKPMFILADPEKAFALSQYPNQGVGLLRMEFIITNSIRVHPMALIKYDELSLKDKKAVDAVIGDYADRKQYFIDKLSESIAIVAAAFYPKDVIVRMSDFKTNEYASLTGGRQFEPDEENPMLGFRGASRYYNERYREGFGLECQAIKTVREKLGLTNVKVMIPFCRTIEEADKVLDTMKEFGLGRNRNGLEVYMMTEIPSNVILAEDFAKRFDGFSIGSNDLTQLTLGIDRDSAIISDLFDENNPAVIYLLKSVIGVARKQGIKIGLCGQAPSDHPGFAKFLVEQGIDSISFNPDAILQGIENIIAAEQNAQLTSSKV